MSKAEIGITIAAQKLLDSADTPEWCSEGLVVVDKACLRELAEWTCDTLPEWLK